MVEYSVDYGKMALQNSEYLKRPSESLSNLLKNRYYSSFEGKMPISFNAISDSNLVTYPLPFLSKILKASNKLKSMRRDNYFLISSISLSILTMSFKAFIRCSSSLPFMGDCFTNIYYYYYY